MKPIVHRDVSPQNIMLSYDGQVKLVDFGIAKALDTMKEETRTGALKGKFAYMAPEQVGGHSPGPQSDIFAAGVVLHEMLTGRRLFKGAQRLRDAAEGAEHDGTAAVDGGARRCRPSSTRSCCRRSSAIASCATTRAAHMARDLDVFLQAHRFAVEDMAEYMKDSLPRRCARGGARRADDVELLDPEGGAGADGAVVAARHRGHAVGGARRGRSRSRRRRRRGRKRALHLRRRGAAGAGVAAIVVVPMARKNSAAARSSDEPRMRASSRRCARPKPTSRLPTTSSPIDCPLTAPAEGDVRVVSEPAGAQVYAGPKLVGTAPVTLHLGRGGAAQVTLVHPGYEDLTYTVQSGDAPSLTLRMLRHHQGGDAVAQMRPPAPERERARTRAKIDAFDDNEKRRTCRRSKRSMTRGALPLLAIAGGISLLLVVRQLVLPPRHRSTATAIRRAPSSRRWAAATWRRCVRSNCQPMGATCCRALVASPAHDLPVPGGLLRRALSGRVWHARRLRRYARRARAAPASVSIRRAAV